MWTPKQSLLSRPVPSPASRRPGGTWPAASLSFSKSSQVQMELGLAFTLRFTTCCCSNFVKEKKISRWVTVRHPLLPDQLRLTINAPETHKVGTGSPTCTLCSGTEATWPWYCLEPTGGENPHPPQKSPESTENSWPREHSTAASSAHPHRQALPTAHSQVHGGQTPVTLTRCAKFHVPSPHAPTLFQPSRDSLVHIILNLHNLFKVTLKCKLKQLLFQKRDFQRML